MSFIWNISQIAIALVIWNLIHSHKLSPLVQTNHCSSYTAVFIMPANLSDIERGTLIPKLPNAVMSRSAAIVFFDVISVCEIEY